MAVPLLHVFGDGGGDFYVMGIDSLCITEGGICPIDCVFDNADNVLVIVGGIAFVTGLEIENLSKLAAVAAAGAENLSAFKAAYENKLVGFGNSEGLAVNLFMLKINEAADTLSDGMRGFKVPNALEVAVTAPKKIAFCTHKELEGF